MKFAAGQYLNLLERALSVTMSPAEDSLFPATNLSDGRPQRAAMHSSNGSNPTITADLAAFTPRGTGSETFEARAGELRTIYSSGSTSTRLQNLSTGNYLTTSGTWQSGSTSCLTSSGSRTYTVEDVDDCQSSVVNMEVTVVSGGNVTDWPRWNAAAVIGHNIDPALTVELRSSDDNFSADDNLQDTATVAQPSFWMGASATVGDRYARLELTGTNQTIPWYGEFIVCYLQSATSNPLYGYEIQYVEDQIRHQGEMGSVYVFNLSPQARRVAKFSFEPTVAAEAEMRQEIVYRSRGGAYPVLLIPDDTDPLVLYGRLDKSWAATRNFLAVWSTDLVVSEEPVAVPLV
jgi:hypothetical protein